MSKFLYCDDNICAVIYFSTKIYQKCILIFYFFGLYFRGRCAKTIYMLKRICVATRQRPLATSMFFIMFCHSKRISIY